MDKSIITKAQHLFGKSYKTRVSPMGTEFIEGSLNGNQYLVSYNRMSNVYVFSENDDEPLSFEGADKVKILLVVMEKILRKKCL